MTPITFPMTITDHMLKELVWKLDREVWSKVPTEIPIEQAWTSSKAREESAKLITEYFGSVDKERKLVSKLVEQRDALKAAIQKYVHHNDLFWNSPKVGQPPDVNKLREVLLIVFTVK